MFVKKILIILALIAVIKLECSGLDLTDIIDTRFNRSVACQTTDWNEPSLETKSSSLFMNGDFNSEYKFSKSEIAQLALITVIVGASDTISVVVSTAYNTISSLLNILFKYH